MFSDDATGSNLKDFSLMDAGNNAIILRASVITIAARLHSQMRGFCLDTGASDCQIINVRKRASSGILATQFARRWSSTVLQAFSIDCITKKVLPARNPAPSATCSPYRLWPSPCKLFRRTCKPSDFRKQSTTDCVTSALSPAKERLESSIIASSSSAQSRLLTG
ncbi:hypothetical protein [Synechococcus sp. CBW1107]|uniref:hypothetical protein n=1 Tax=Synechococcus sp. CBW1107 TaxID=2789857 RepID=UPI002AD2166A|nr:hypothetical protein [Synechococcus sp. CBW1107]